MSPMKGRRIAATMQVIIIAEQIAEMKLVPPMGAYTLSSIESKSIANEHRVEPANCLPNQKREAKCEEKRPCKISNCHRIAFKQNPKNTAAKISVSKNTCTKPISILFGVLVATSSAMMQVLLENCHSVVVVDAGNPRSSTGAEYMHVSVDVPIFSFFAHRGAC
jgi:hypothetical protein